MSGKIWAFGCSQTYGHGLEDCFEDSVEWPNGAGEKPSNFSYPQLIGNALNKEVINLSRPGASNKHILHRIKMAQPEMASDDIVLIGWTNKDRYIILKEDIDLDTNHDYLHPNQIGKSKLADIYYKNIHDDNDAEIVTRWYMNYAYLTLKAMAIRSIHCPISFWGIPGGEFEEIYKPQGMFGSQYFKSQTSDSRFEVGLQLLSKTFMDIQTDFALDGMHGGPKTHRAVSDLIIAEFLTQ
jgi:hypothetical protein